MLYPSAKTRLFRQTARLAIAGVLIAGTCFALAACDSVERFAIRSQRSLSNFFTFSDHEEYTAQELALNGMESYENGNYRAAARNFQELKDFYPFSQYAALADLKLGDSYYQRKQYEQAIAAYEDFERLHPRNEAIPYVIYKIGMCYYDQMPTIDRDQSMARKAMETFLRLQRQFPGDQYAQLVDPLIPECIRKLAGHEFSIGLFYFETSHFIAAKQRFEKVLRNYPDVGYHREAMIYLIDCEKRIAAENAELVAAGEAPQTDLTIPEIKLPTIGEEDLTEDSAVKDDKGIELPGTKEPTESDEMLIQEVDPELMQEDIPLSEGEFYPDL